MNLVTTALVTAIAMFFSSFTSPYLSGMFTIALWIIGHLLADLRNFGSKSDLPGLKELLEALYWTLPNLDRLDIKADASAGRPIELARVGIAVLYAWLYSFVLMSGAMPCSSGATSGRANVRTMRESSSVPAARGRGLRVRRVHRQLPERGDLATAARGVAALSRLALSRLSAGHSRLGQRSDPVVPGAGRALSRLSRADLAALPVRRGADRRAVRGAALRARCVGRCSSSGARRSAVADLHRLDHYIIRTGSRCRVSRSDS
jgi:hypothetical protein